MPDAAVVIGINYNEFPPEVAVPAQRLNGPRPLRYAQADAQEMGDILFQAGYNVARVIGADATRSNIIAKIAKQRQLAVEEPKGRLVVHFAGHGLMVADDKSIDPVGY